MFRIIEDFFFFVIKYYLIEVCVRRICLRVRSHAMKTLTRHFHFINFS